MSLDNFEGFMMLFSCLLLDHLFFACDCYFVYTFQILDKILYYLFIIKWANSEIIHCTLIGYKLSCNNGILLSCRKQ